MKMSMYKPILVYWKLSSMKKMAQEKEVMKKKLSSLLKVVFLIVYQSRKFVLLLRGLKLNN